MKRTLLFCLLLTASGLLYAGDIANFVNLGFSDDSRYLMFAQYGALDDSSKHYADIFGVDVNANTFVPNGVKTAVYDEALMPGQEGIGALFTLYSTSVSLAKQYKVNHMTTGRLLYLLIDGQEPKKRLEFRDFDTGRSYQIELFQTQFGDGRSVSASFHINLTIADANGNSRHYTVGLPSYRRDGVKKYRIQQIIYSPDEKSLVFIIEKEESAKNGINIRYMVETVSIN